MDLEEKFQPQCENVDNNIFMNILLSLLLIIMLFFLHFISAVVLGAERCGNGHHHRRASVAKHVEIAVQEAFVVDDADDNEVQMDALDAHPCKGSQEEIVQQPRNDRAEELERNTRPSLTGGTINEMFHCRCNVDFLDGTSNSDRPCECSC